MGYLSFVMLTVVCPAIWERSLAPHQPFQLYLDSKYVTWDVMRNVIHRLERAPWNMTVSNPDGGGWLHVDNNTCDSHICVEHVMGCTRRY